MPVVHAMLRDFEFAVEYLNVAHPDAIEKSRVLVDRTGDIRRWLDLTGIPPTQEEMDEASREMLDSKSREIAEDLEEQDAAPRLMNE
jgi:hypothetical protein